MPAQDHYHRTVIRAFAKDGWTVLKEQFPILLPERRLWVDLHMATDQNRRVLVEVKGFENMASPIEYLAATTGKYLLYRTALDRLQVEMQLYLAVPTHAYSGILSETLGRLVIQHLNMPIVVFDPEQEVITLWKP